MSTRPSTSSAGFDSPFNHGGNITTPRTLTVKAGNGSDACKLCGIHRENAGFLRATCGEGYLKSDCFVTREAE